MYTRLLLLSSISGAAQAVRNEVRRTPRLPGRAATCSPWLSTLSTDGSCLFVFPPEPHRPWFVQKMRLCKRRWLRSRYGFPCASPSRRWRRPFRPLTAVTGILPWNLPRFCLIRGGNLEGRHTDRGPLTSWKRWTHRKSILIDSMQKRVILPKSEWTLEIPSPKMEQYNLTAGDRWECREDFLAWIERVSTNNTFSRLISRCWWSARWFMVHLRETSDTAITLNQQSNSTRREKSHFIHLRSPESLILPWMCYRKAVSNMIGTSMDQENCPIHGKISDNSPYWRKSF